MSLADHVRRGETRPAIDAARRLEREVHGGGPGAGALEGLRDAFFALLDLRGYFVRTAAEVSEAIREIREVGAGFDLYDLAEALAACDCRGVSNEPRIPELKEFQRPCACPPQNGGSP